MAKAVKRTARRAVKRTAQLGPKQAVRIDRDGRVLDNDNPAKVRKSVKEDVLWIATGGGGPWWVTFDKPNSNPPGSPFSEDSYKVEKGGSNGSTGGPVNGTVGKTYRYNVRARSKTGPITHDPDVDIE